MNYLFENVVWKTGDFIICGEKNEAKQNKKKKERKLERFLKFSKNLGFNVVIDYDGSLLKGWLYFKKATIKYNTLFFF